MKHALSDSWKSMLNLLRFLFWYGTVLAAVLYLLPWAGQLAQQQYEAMSSMARFFSVIGFFMVVGAWQVVSRHVRMKAERPGRQESSADVA